MDQRLIVTAFYLNVGGGVARCFNLEEAAGRSALPLSVFARVTVSSLCLEVYIAPSVFIGRVFYVPLLVFRLKCVLQAQPLAREC